MARRMWSRTKETMIKWKHALIWFFMNAKYLIWYNIVGFMNISQDMFKKNQNKTDLPLNSGKTALITGGTRGIGFEVIKLLLKCGINVIMGCRNVKQGEALLQKFRDEGINRGNIKVYQLDTSELSSVRKFASEVKSKHRKIDYLINNAGILFGPFKETSDGYESQFATNYLGHFLLTHLLLPELKRTGTGNHFARIVNVSSCAHMMGKIMFDDINLRKVYVPALGYAQSKLALVLFANYLNDMLAKENENVQALSAHPGVVNTEIFNDTHWRDYTPWLINWFFRKPEEGAYSIIHACLSPSLEGKGGIYIQNCQISSPSRRAKDVHLQEKLFNFTKQLLDIEKFSSLE